MTTDDSAYPEPFTIDDVDSVPGDDEASHAGRALPDGECAMMRALDLVSSKWAVPVVYCLHHARGPIRFRELQRRVGAITQKELTRRLREFERAGLVHRRVYPQVPPRVEYELTPLGATLVTPLAALACWAETHGDELDENRRRHDAGRRNR